MGSKAKPSFGISYPVEGEEPGSRRYHGDVFMVHKSATSVSVKLDQLGTNVTAIQVIDGSEQEIVAEFTKTFDEANQTNQRRSRLGRAVARGRIFLSIAAAVAGFAGLEIGDLV